MKPKLSLFYLSKIFSTFTVFKAVESNKVQVYFLTPLNPSFFKEIVFIFMA